VDRRIQKSRQAIVAGFVRLLGRKAFGKITVNEIADEADVNRGTVYLHYRDKYELLESTIDEYVVKLLCYCEKDGPTFKDPGAVRRVFEFMDANYDVYAVFMRGEGASRFRARFSEVIVENLRELLARQAPAPRHANASRAAVSADIGIHFVVSAVLGVLEWWFTQQRRLTVDEVSGALWNMIEPHYPMFGVTAVNPGIATLKNRTA